MRRRWADSTFTTQRPKVCPRDIHHGDTHETQTSKENSFQICWPSDFRHSNRTCRVRSKCWLKQPWPLHTSARIGKINRKIGWWLKTFSTEQVHVTHVTREQRESWIPFMDFAFNGHGFGHYTHHAPWQNTVSSSVTLVLPTKLNNFFACHLFQCSLSDKRDSSFCFNAAE